MPIQFQVQLKEKDLYAFTMYHSYHSQQGILSIVIALFAFFAAYTTRNTVESSYTFLYIIFGIVFLVYIPVTLKMRAKVQMKGTGPLQSKLLYKIDDTGITATLNEESAILPWKQVYKIAGNKKYIYVYSNKVHAYIFPADQMDGQYEKIKEIAKKNLEKYRFALK